MKIIEIIKYTVFCFSIVICGCSEVEKQPSSEEPSVSELLKVLDITWWDVSLPENFDPSTNSYDSLQFVIQDSDGNIVKQSGAGSAPDIGKSVRVFVQKRPDSEIMDLSIIYENGTFRFGINSMRSLGLEDIGTRLSGENISVGDVMMKGRTENFTYDTYDHGAGFNTIQQGEIGLVLRIKKDDE